MDFNKVKTIKLSILDDIELKSATFIDKIFPIHFHQSWSLAYIEMGCENISFNEFDFFLNKNALILIPPFSLHKNWGNKNNAWTYQALYINNDVIKNIAKKINVDYAHLADFPYYISYCNDFNINEKSIFKLLENLFLDTLKADKLSSFNKCSSEPFDEILNYLNLNFNEPISLESLQEKFKINKYKLQKSFKKKIGLSPLEYQTSIRIENSKQLFYSDAPLVDIALESGFFDQSHFSHSFKKYVGVSPGNYKKNCNILQDWQSVSS